MGGGGSLMNKTLHVPGAIVLTTKKKTLRHCAGLFLSEFNEPALVLPHNAEKNKTRFGRKKNANRGAKINWGKKKS